MIRTVLVANRGEIALRVIRACRLLGLRTVVVHSEADRDSWPVALADEAVQIGPAAPQDSYLSIPGVIEAARTHGADAVHPGYGFLSEDPDFAEICYEEGLLLVGPSAAALSTLGDKAAARSLMTTVGVPLLEGSTSDLGTAGEAADLAGRIGYPVIIKAVAGGGGRGMRVVDDPSAFHRSWAETRADAARLFGDSRVFVERYLPHARHVEVQVLADDHGGMVHLGTRDCSLQRRNQKVVEEAPAPGLDPDLRERICAAAVTGMSAAGYSGVGTVEFLVDDDGGFHFLEANCRIQVEHPVTEMVTGVDLVAEQLRVADGRPLGFTQDDVHLSGSAVEARIYAEDPDAGFRPSPGLLVECRLPGGPFVRVDSHVHAGHRFPAQYDPLLAKVAAWAPDRDTAVDRLDVAVGETVIDGPGVATNTAFVRRLLADDGFRKACHDTRTAEAIASDTADGRSPR